MTPPPDNNAQFIDDFCRRLQTLLENSPLAGIQQMGEDGKDNIRALGESLLAKMNVVSRAEFDAQSAILAQTAEKLEQLEKKIEELENS